MYLAIGFLFIVLVLCWTRYSSQEPGTANTSERVMYVTQDFCLDEPSGTQVERVTVLNAGDEAIEVGYSDKWDVDCDTVVEPLKYKSFIIDRSGKLFCSETA